MEYRLDMTTMFTIHDAFRRNLAEIATVAAEADRGGRAHLGERFSLTLRSLSAVSSPNEPHSTAV